MGVADNTCLNGILASYIPDYLVTLLTDAGRHAIRYPCSSNSVHSWQHAEWPLPMQHEHHQAFSYQMEPKVHCQLNVSRVPNREGISLRCSIQRST